MKRLDKWSF